MLGRLRTNAIDARRDSRTKWGRFFLERKKTRVASRWLQSAFVVVLILALAKLQLGWVTHLVVPSNHLPHLAAFPLENEVEELPTIKYLQRFTHIIVSGPQRSGTTFVAGAIAKELEYRHLMMFKAVLNVSTECASLEPQRNLTFECNGCWLSLFESEETLLHSVLKCRTFSTSSLNILPATHVQLRRTEYS